MDCIKISVTIGFMRVYELWNIVEFQNFITEYMESKKISFSINRDGMGDPQLTLFDFITFSAMCWSLDDVTRLQDEIVNVAEKGAKLYGIPLLKGHRQDLMVTRNHEILGHW